jgi:hypothetical protein
MPGSSRAWTREQLPFVLIVIVQFLRMYAIIESSHRTIISLACYLVIAALLFSAVPPCSPSATSTSHKCLG